MKKGDEFRGGERVVEELSLERDCCLFTVISVIDRTG